MNKNNEENKEVVERIITTSGSPPNRWDYIGVFLIVKFVQSL
jgi:hypothetical protein